MNGIINVYKEKGYTSHDVVAKLRGICRQKKIGHTGTLDPDAEGVLPVCLGTATKVCGLLTDKDKVYEAVLLLGTQTDTQDISGTVVRQAQVTCTQDEVRQAAASFLGIYSQLPPMYSALKVNGKKLCDLARAGVEVERSKRQVSIYEIEVLWMRLPRVKLRVHCSKGTYIRTGKSWAAAAAWKNCCAQRSASFRWIMPGGWHRSKAWQKKTAWRKSCCPQTGCFWNIRTQTFCQNTQGFYLTATACPNRLFLQRQKAAQMRSRSYVSIFAGNFMPFINMMLCGMTISL